MSCIEQKIINVIVFAIPRRNVVADVLSSHRCACLPIIFIKLPKYFSPSRERQIINYKECNGCIHYRYQLIPQHNWLSL